MPYIINKYDGTPLIVLNDGTLDTSTSVGLLGRNYVGYGETQNENFLFLLENFANENPPPRPLEGQTWFNKTDKILNVYTGSRWNPISSATISETEPIASEGMLWYKISTEQLFIYSNEQWKLIAPDGLDNYGITRIKAEIIFDTDVNEHPVLKAYIDNVVVAIFSKDSFRIGASSSIPGFLDINSGITLPLNFSFTGNLVGNANTSSKLRTPRTINGVTFDGSTDIIINSSTSNAIIPGSNIIGTPFNGSTETIWEINASDKNDSDTVVSRDSSGNFSAGTITANLIGNVSGNLFGNVTSSTGSSSFNLISANEIFGPLRGNATSATRLETARSINNVPFDGVSDITIESSTTNPLVPGNHIIGNMFDGSTQTTWSVDSYSTNNSNTIVSRDSSGNFSAGTITANLIGNVSGNVISAGTSNFNLITANAISGTLTGNASTASRLQTARTINGVPFDGTTDVNIGSATSNSLIAGTHINGDNFNGSKVTTWSINAFSSNSANTIVSRDSNGNFSASTISANLTGNVSGNSATSTRLRTARSINGVSFDGTSNITITAQDPDSVTKSGDTMSGYLTLHADPVQIRHAATKRYVDNKVSSVPQATQFRITSGTNFSSAGHSNIVGFFSDAQNYFDIFPPAGKSMSNLVAFIPSIAVIHFNGDVNFDDSMRCLWSNLGNRIRVYVQNTEQRSNPAANWLAIWS